MMRTTQLSSAGGQRCSAARLPPGRAAAAAGPARRPPLVAAAVAQYGEYAQQEEWAPRAPRESQAREPELTGDVRGEYGDARTYQPRRGGGRGGGGGSWGGRGGRGGGGGGGGYGNRRGYDQQQGGGQYGEPRGPVSYEEDGEGGAPRGGRGYGRGGYRGGRGGGRGGGRRSDERAPLSPEVAAINEAIERCTSWRELQTVLEQQSRPGMPGLDPFQLVSVLLRLVQLDKPAAGDDAADYQQFVASVYGWMMDRMPRLRARQISRALYAIGRLNLYNAELVGALLTASLPQLGSFNAFDFVRLLDGLASMNVAPTPEWTAAFFTPEIADRILRSSAQDELGSILTFCQRLGLTPTPEWLDLMSEAALRQQAERGQMMRASGFKRVVVGLAGLGWRPSPQQHAELVACSMKHLAGGGGDFLRARDLSELAWGFAQWGTPVSPQWAQAFCSQLMQQQRYLRPDQLGSTLYSLAYIQAGPTPAQLGSLLGTLSSRYDATMGDDLANVLMALAQFQFNPGERRFDDLLLELQSKLGTCSAAGLNNIISALPALGNGIRLNQVLSEAVSRYDAMMAAESGAAAEPAPEAQPVA